MSPETHRFLMKLDAKDHWERPPNFSHSDYKSWVKRIKNVQETLETIVGEEMNFHQGQDTTTLATCEVQRLRQKLRYGKEEIQRNWWIALYGVSYSYFVGLATVYSLLPDEADFEVLEKIKNAVEEAGFFVVSYSDLQEIYDGVHSDQIPGTMNWYERYFGYH